MKALVALSLLLNAALAMALWRSPGAAPASVTARPARTNAVELYLQQRAQRATAARAATANPWHSLAAGDYRSLIAQLRAAGCPEETIRDLVVMRLTRDTRERLLAGEMQFFARSNWWRNPVTYADNNQMQRERRHARVQMQIQLEDLLGVPTGEMINALVGWDMPARNAWLAPEKRRELALLLDRFEDEDEEIRQGRRGHSIALTSVQRQQLAELRQRQRAELAQFLTPEELRAYDLRSSDAAAYVQQKLPDARSEAEFAKMVQVAQDMKLAPNYLRDDYDPSDFRSTERRDAEELKLVLEKLKTELGTDTIAAYEQAQVDAEAKKKAEAETQEKERELKEATEMVQAAGLDVALAPKFLDRLMAAAKEFNRQNNESNLTEAQRKETEAKAMALFDTIAVEVFGERGVELRKQIEKKEKGR